MLSRKYIFMAALLAVIVAIAAAPQITLAADHPDSCLKCHADTTNDLVNETDSRLWNKWNHTIYTGDKAWTQCKTCHTNLNQALQNTVHAGMGCSCHAVLHVGYNFGGTTGVYGAAFYRVPSTGGQGDFIAPQQVTFATKYVEYTESNISSVLPSTASMEVEVGLVQLFGTASGNPEYVNVSATVYTPCFNCHFLATDPSTVGAFKFVEGAWKIGIPETALSLPPHEITGVELASAGESSGPSIPVIFSMGVGLLGAGLVLFAGRRK